MTTFRRRCDASSDSSIPDLCSFENDLPSAEDHEGFGHPEIAPHLHNFHTASESDGGPWRWISPKDNPEDKPNTRNFHYTMARAGFEKQKGIPAKWVDPITGGDLRETLTTLFLHDHRPEFTAANVYKGMVCMVRAFDQDDTGNLEFTRREAGDDAGVAWRVIPPHATCVILGGVARVCSSLSRNRRAHPGSTRRPCRGCRGCAGSRRKFSAQSSAKCMVAHVEM